MGIQHFVSRSARRRSYRANASPADAIEVRARRVQSSSAALSEPLTPRITWRRQRALCRARSEDPRRRPLRRRARRFPGGASPPESRRSEWPVPSRTAASIRAPSRNRRPRRAFSRRPLSSRVPAHRARDPCNAQTECIRRWRRSRREGLRRRVRCLRARLRLVREDGPRAIRRQRSPMRHQGRCARLPQSLTWNARARVEGRIVLITGGAIRVGAAICRRLHAEGANLMLHYRASAGEARLLQAELNHIRSESVALIQADLLDLNKLPAMVDRRCRRSGDWMRSSTMRRRFSRRRSGTSRRRRGTTSSERIFARRCFSRRLPRRR